MAGTPGPGVPPEDEDIPEDKDIPDLEEPDVFEDESVGTGPPEPVAGLLSDDPLPGRPRDQDILSHAEEVREGLSAEEAAVRIASDEDAEQEPDTE